MEIVSPLNLRTGFNGRSAWSDHQQIQEEIQAKLGFIPPFFGPSLKNAEILENLWHQTLLAYLDNPLPALFKEKLSAYLSRFCVVPYCMICHSCSLHTLGMQAADVLELLQSPPPTEFDVEQDILYLMAQPGSLEDLSQLDAVPGLSVLKCAIFIALHTEPTESCREALRHYLGVNYYQHLIAFIAYVKTCHVWMEAHPEVAYQNDRRVQGHFDALIEAAPELADFFNRYRERVAQEQKAWAEQQENLAARRRQDVALRKLEEQNHTLARAIAATPGGILITDPGQLDNPIIYANPAFLRITGYELDEVLGQNCRFLQGADTDQNTVAQIRQAIAEQREISTTILNYRKDGRPFWNELKITPIISEDGKLLYFVGLQTDVSERKQAEDNLQKQTETLQKQAQLLELAYDAILVRNMEDQITFWNQAAEKTYGWLKSEIAGQHSHTTLRTQFPKTIESIQAELLQNNHWEGELIHYRKDGKSIVVNSRWALQRDKDGHPIAVLEINSDITDKKVLEAQFLRAQRMESIGTLAGGIAHDLNNILTPILSSAQLLLKQTKAEDKKQQQLLEIVQSSARRGAALIKQVLSFARGVEGKRTSLQIQHLVSEIRQIVQGTFPKSIELHLDLARDLWLVSGDATQLHQVLMNLCVNARDAMLDGGSLNLSTANLWIDEQYARMNLDATVGPYVVITVADTGTGIAPEVLDRIFEPFFTTKDLGQGTGLGLSTVLAIVKSHGGFMEVNSRLGKGTEFKIYLPAVQTDEMLEAPEEEVPSGHGELILVVDDEAAIRDSNQASLEAYNYRSLTAGDGIEAIAIFAEHRHEISLALVDLMMPSMDGAAAIRALRKLNPQVKIIAVSGLVSSSQISTSISSEIHAFLPKPYTAKELVKCIAEVL
ncbi:MAG TPA: PAS domain-containing protein [Crinalium sp.]